MTTDRHSAAMVYLEGCIYVIGGIQENEDGKRVVNDMERYDIIKKKWETLPLLDAERQYSEFGLSFFSEKISAITFQGKIIVYRIVYNEITEFNFYLMVYHPDRNVWKIMHEEEIAPYVEDRVQRMLFKHKGRCYKILYDCEEDFSSVSNLHQYYLPSVHALDIKTEGDDTLSISIGEEFPQNDLPYGTFRIDNEVFMVKKGLAYKTDVNLKPLHHGQPQQRNFSGIVFRM